MLHTPASFRRFTSKDIADADKALAAGGRAPREAQDHGFMYERAFEDPDGHIWEIFWMNTQAVPQ